MSYILSIDKFGYHRVYKNDEFLGDLEYWPKNGFLCLAREKLIFLHDTCPIKRIGGVCYHDHNNKELDYCMALPQVKIEAYLTRENLVKKIQLLMLNNPFIHLRYFSVQYEYHIDNTLLQIANRCDLFEFKTNRIYRVNYWLKCECGAQGIYEY